MGATVSWVKLSIDAPVSILTLDIKKKKKKILEMKILYIVTATRVPLVKNQVLPGSSVNCWLI